MKLFVAKLNREAVESDLIDWFSTIGPVKSAKIVMDRDTGQSKCFGFVEMARREDGERVVRELNGQTLMGFQAVIKEAEDRPRKPFNQGGAGRLGPDSRGGETRGAPGAPGGSSGGARPHAGELGSADRSGAFKGTSPGGGLPKKSSSKKKSKKDRPDKYADGPRNLKMKRKPKGGKGLDFWDDLDV